METRIASYNDADGMSLVLREIATKTGRERLNNTDFVVSHYIANPCTIRCTIAIDETNRIVGFQSLKKAESGNRYNVPEGWGIIGTHVSPRAHRQGVGKLLFSSSMEAADRARLQKIDAYIGADNSSGLRYYEAMGFRTYRESDGIVQKVLVLQTDSSAGS